MALPPFNELRLKPGEWPDQQKLEELFDGIFRNFEDAYQNFATSSKVQETAAANKEIIGIINASGVRVAGSGFGVAHPSTGIYEIALAEELPTIGICIPTGVTSGGIFYVEANTKKVFRVVAFNAGGTALTNLAFNFIIKAT